MPENDAYVNDQGEPMSDTITGNAAPIVAVCACCHDHDDRPLTWDVVTCKTCGALCSCEGCVAEADAR